VRSGAIAALLLVGGLSTSDGNAQDADDPEAQGAAEAASDAKAEARAEAQAKELQARLKDAFGARELPQASAPSTDTSRYAQRRALRETRRQAKLERSDEAVRVVAATGAVVGLAGSEAKQGPLPAPTAHRESVSAAGPSEIKVSFRLAGSGPAEWAGEDNFTTPLLEGNVVTLDAMVHARDPQGQTMEIRPEWKSADANTVEVLPAEGVAVKITVRGRGESNLTLSGPGFSKELWISATGEGSALRVQIVQ
jgi:hypothetical protein